MKQDQEDRRDPLPDYVFIPGRVQLIITSILLAVIIFYALMLGLTR